MLIRFKNDKNDVCIFNTETIRELYIKELQVEYSETESKRVFAIVIAGNDNERHYCNCLSQEQAIKALDKIYTAYADGARAITIEVD